MAREDVAGIGSRLTAVQRDVLATIRVQAGRVTTMPEIAARAGCSRGHAIKSVAELVRKGLVGREVVHDRSGAIRGVHLWTTESGAKIGAAA